MSLNLSLAQNQLEVRDSLISTLWNHIALQDSVLASMSATLRAKDSIIFLQNQMVSDLKEVAFERDTIIDNNEYDEFIDSKAKTLWIDSLIGLALGIVVAIFAFSISRIYKDDELANGPSEKLFE